MKPLYGLFKESRLSVILTNSYKIFIEADIFLLVTIPSLHSLHTQQEKNVHIYLKTKTKYMALRKNFSCNKDN